MAGADRIASPADPLALCRALGHEIGNALAAVRLAAHVLAREGGGAARAGAAADAAAAASRAGVALGELRALLADAPASPAAAAPALVVAAVRSALPADTASRVESSPADGLRVARAEPEALAHVLAGLALALDDAGGAAETLRLRVEPTSAGVTFSLEGRGARGWSLEPDPGREPSGSALQLRVAASLAARWGGALALVEAGSGARVELRLPFG